MQRMWINQPSTHQPHHNLHGQRVLAEPTTEKYTTIWFTNGPTHSMVITIQALSYGWPPQTQSK